MIPFSNTIGNPFICCFVFLRYDYLDLQDECAYEDDQTAVEEINSSLFPDIEMVHDHGLMDPDLKRIEAAEDGLLQGRRRR